MSSGKKPLDTLSQYFTDLEAINAHIRLTADEERTLSWKMKRGPKNGRAAARARLIEANLPLAVWWAKREYQRVAAFCHGVDLDDMVQEANLGLCYAIDRYDANKGRVTTYVSFRIRQCLRRYIAERTTVVRTPVGAFQTIAPVAQAQAAFLKANGREATPEELAEALEWRLSHVERALSAASARNEHAPIDSFDVDFLAGIASSTVYESPADEPEQSLSDDDAKLFDLTLQAIHELPVRLRTVLSRYGRGDSLYLIGDDLGVSHERVRQLVMEARGLVVDAVNAGEITGGR